MCLAVVSVENNQQNWRFDPPQHWSSLIFQYIERHADFAIRTMLQGCSFPISVHQFTPPSSYLDNTKSSTVLLLCSTIRYYYGNTSSAELMIVPAVLRRYRVTQQIEGRHWFSYEGQDGFCANATKQYGSAAHGRPTAGGIWIIRVIRYVVLLRRNDIALKCVQVSKRSIPPPWMTCTLLP